MTNEERIAFIEKEIRAQDLSHEDPYAVLAMANGLARWRWAALQGSPALQPSVHDRVDEGLLVDLEPRTGRDRPY